MATKNTKVTAGEIVSSTRKYSNAEDENRKFNISVDVIIKDGKATNFNSGTFSRTDTDSYGNGNFNCGSNLSFFSFNTNGLSLEETKEAFNAVYSFIEGVNADVESSSKDE